jgi:beta-glucosidase
VSEVRLKESQLLSSRKLESGIADSSFTLTPDDLRFYDANPEFVNEPGEFKVFCGPDNSNVKEATFSLIP